jgi:hypothetical protein
VAWSRSGPPTGRRPRESVPLGLPVDYSQQRSRIISVRWRYWDAAPVVRCRPDETAAVVQLPVDRRCRGEAVGAAVGDQGGDEVPRVGRQNGDPQTVSCTTRPTFVPRVVWGGAAG